MLGWMHKSVVLGVMGSVGFAPGCATVATGGVQAIDIQSEPAGAQRTVTREGEKLGTVVTPNRITISRSKSTVQVACTKTGYQEVRDFLVPRMEPASVADALPLAQAVNLMSGAGNRYPSNLMVWLTPQGSPAKTATAPAPAAATAAPVVAMTPSSSAAASLPPGPFDGRYSGTFDLLRTITWQMTVTVVAGSGTGTSSSSACPFPGEVRLTIDPSGAVSGEIDLKNATCQAGKRPMSGKVQGDRIDIQLSSGKIGFSLTKQP
jgi:hypothetical protein